MKFICDEMLQRLGRWLRTAGYDTEIINDGRDDYEILQQARKQGRILLTCDQAMTQYRDADKHVVLLDTTTLDELVQQLTHKCQVNWQFRPFSRCMTCNTKLQQANQQQRQSVPEDVAPTNEIFYCPACNKVYWDGSHVERMREQLQQWHIATNN